MNDIESRLTDAMAERAREVEPHDEDDALKRISERVNMSHRRAFMILGVAAAVAVAVGTVALLNRGDDKQTQHINTATNSGNTSTTTNTTPTTVFQSAAPAIWPFESMNRTFATPEEAAKSFAVDYLGMTLARVGTTLPPADAGGASSVEVFANDRASLRTLVNVVEQPPRGWVVIGASADEIVVDTPKPHDPLAASMNLAGRSRAFEAQLGIQLRSFGSTTSVLEDSAMGGSTEILPFSTTIAPPATDQPLVLVIFEGDASGQGAMSQATVIPLDAAGSPEPATFIGQAANGDLTLLDFAGHVQQPSSAQDKAALENAATLPSKVSGTLPTLRGRFATIAFFDGTQIASYNPANGNVVQLLAPPAKPISLDADESGRFLLWVDVNHDLWKWSGGEALKVGSGFTSAAW